MSRWMCLLVLIIASGFAAGVRPADAGSDMGVSNARAACDPATPGGGAAAPPAAAPPAPTADAPAGTTLTGLASALAQPPDTLGDEAGVTLREITIAAGATSDVRQAGGPRLFYVAAGMVDAKVAGAEDW